MVVPPRSFFRPRADITATLYTQWCQCPARVAWRCSSAAVLVPTSPHAILGMAFHKVLEMARSSPVPGDGVLFKDWAGALFDRKAVLEYERAHPLLRVKYLRPADMPEYYLQRARALALGAALAGRSLSRKATISQGVRGNKPSEQGQKGVEKTLVSRDELLRGIADVIEPDQRAVVDYKSGAAPTDGAPLSDAERTQLMFYAYLAAENGIAVDQGTIVRGTGETATIETPADQARAVADAAREALTTMNVRAQQNAAPADLAEPSPQACRACPFIPLCSGFWRQASESWAEEVGRHVELTVRSARSFGRGPQQMLHVHGARTAGTVSTDHSEVHLLLPERWLVGTPIPQAGQTVRATYVFAGADPDASEWRLSPALGALWVVGRE